MNELSPYPRRDLGPSPRTQILARRLMFLGIPSLLFACIGIGIVAFKPIAEWRRPNPIDLALLMPVALLLFIFFDQLGSYRKEARMTGGLRMPRVVRCGHCGASIGSEAAQCPSCGSVVHALIPTAAKSPSSKAIFAAILTAAWALAMLALLGGLSRHGIESGHRAAALVFVCGLKAVFYCRMRTIWKRELF